MISSMPYIFLFLTTMFAGTMISISSNNWLLMWMGLELNLLSFIPIMKAASFQKGTEAVMKYFLTQACASIIIITMMCSHMLSKEVMLNENQIIMMIMISLMMKLGMTPCHWWFPMVMTNLNWFMSLMLLTWQKVAPMLIVLKLSDMTNHSMLALIISSSALIGGIGGNNQTNIKPLLAFSSIGHMSWILATSIVSWTASLIYFMIYMIVASSLIMFFMVNNINSSFKKLLSWKTMNPYKAAAMCTLLLSMAGIPPFLGFMPKMLTFTLLANYNTLMILLFLYLGSVLNLSYYMNLTFHISINPFKTKTIQYYMNSINMLLMAVSTMPILLFSTMM